MAACTSSGLSVCCVLKARLSMKLENTLKANEIRHIQEKFGHCKIYDVVVYCRFCDWNFWPRARSPAGKNKDILYSPLNYSQVQGSIHSSRVPWSCACCVMQKNTHALEDKLKEIKVFIQKEKQAIVQVVS
jgi:hypothetical protein